MIQVKPTDHLKIVNRILSDHGCVLRVDEKNNKNMVLITMPWKVDKLMYLGKEVPISELEKLYSYHHQVFHDMKALCITGHYIGLYDGKNLLLITNDVKLRSWK